MRHEELLIRLEPDQRADLLEVLTATRSIRAERIREYWSHPEGRSIADTLIDLEVDDCARVAFLSELRRLEGVADLAG